MTPKEKAEELVAKLRPYADRGIQDTENNEIESAKQCAMICVEKIIDHMDENWNNVNWVSEQSVTYNYWNKVKQEIEKL